MDSNKDEDKLIRDKEAVVDKKASLYQENLKAYKIK